MNNKKEIYIFLHISRTGGVSLFNNIEKNLDEGEIFPIHKIIKKPISLYFGEKEKEKIKKKIMSMTKNQRDEIKVIYGHDVFYGIHKYFNKEPRYIVFYREPIKIKISLLNRRKDLIDSKSKDKSFIPEEVLKKNPELGSLIDFLKKRNFIKRNIKNINVKDLKEVIEKFYFIGITENYKEDSLFLYYKLKVKKFYKNRNISKKFYTVKSFLKNKNFVKKSPKTRELNNKFYELCLEKNKEFKRNNLFFYPIVIYMKIKRRLCGYTKENETKR